MQLKYVFDYFLRSFLFFLFYSALSSQLTLSMILFQKLMHFGHSGNGRVDRASATEAVDTGPIPGRVKPKTIKIGIHSFPA